MLLSDGHRVVGLTRTPSKAEWLRAAGAEAVVADGLDAAAVRQAVDRARPEVVIHQMTALSGMRELKHFDREFAVTNRLRTEGTRHLLSAAIESGATRFIAQSYTGWPNARTGGRVKTEEDPLEENPPAEMRQSLQAIKALEEMTTRAAEITGIVLRYGNLYGPGTSLGEQGAMTQLVRERKLPIFGTGDGVWSFIHVDDAANATRLAVNHGSAGIYNIVDDDPAELSEWLPELARLIGAKPPAHLPAWMGRLAIGETGMAMMNGARGSSNAKAKAALGWKPLYSSWREGFRYGLADSAREERTEPVR